jgi:sugar/nucleoside kinase (ribokinase family)
MNRAEISRSAADALRAFAPHAASTPVMIGFDGFVDTIIQVVEQRHSPDRYEPVKTIARFGEKILAAAGQSSNYELVTTLEKLGGNGPIMANAVATLGMPTTYLGALGYPSIHPVFAPFRERAECVSFCDPGFTDALEFSDGKLMLGKHASLCNVNAARLLDVVGLERLRALMASCRLLGMVNWTMLTQSNSIWDLLVDEVLPGLPRLEGGRRIVFIDLTDPEKRTRDDLLGALAYGKRFQAHAEVYYGFNLKESTQAAGVLGLDVGKTPEANIEQTAEFLCRAMDVQGVVIHPRAGAAAARRDGEKVERASFAGPMVREPRLSTGAGDNFNAGFCLGVVAGMTLTQALCVGTATSGYYVRHAESPTLDALAAFCDNLPSPE